MPNILQWLAENRKQVFAVGKARVSGHSWQAMLLRTCRGISLELMLDYGARRIRITARVGDPDFPFFDLVEDYPFDHPFADEVIQKYGGDVREKNPSLSEYICGAQEAL